VDTSGEAILLPFSARDACGDMTIVVVGHG
jgi:hypothetical protein